ncbi:MAG: AzlC family ABC transporter permease [Clostridiaceae bacterium]|nr:AzlC family ABC transporter permease [Clostridiaceae bacterium]
MHQGRIKSAFKSTLPVLFGYVPLGMGFGILLTGAGYPWYLATIMAIIMYAGAAQYMAVKFFTQSLPFYEIALVTLFVNLRHMVYGLSLLDDLKEKNIFNSYIIFGLTDETYAILQNEKKENYFLISLFNQIYWITGCTLGAILGQFLPFSSEGIEFALTSLFVVLAVDMYKSAKSKLPFRIALFCGILAYFISKENMLILSIAISAVILLLTKGRLENESA